MNNGGHRADGDDAGSGAKTLVLGAGAFGVGALAGLLWSAVPPLGLVAVVLLVDAVIVARVLVRRRWRAPHRRRGDDVPARTTGTLGLLLIAPGLALTTVRPWSGLALTTWGVIAMALGHLLPRTARLEPGGSGTTDRLITGALAALWAGAAGLGLAALLPGAARVLLWPVLLAALVVVGCTAALHRPAGSGGSGGGRWPWWLATGGWVLLVVAIGLAGPAATAVAGRGLALVAIGPLVLGHGASRLRSAGRTGPGAIGLLAVLSIAVPLTLLAAYAAQVRSSPDYVARAGRPALVRPMASCQVRAEPVDNRPIAGCDRAVTVDGRLVTLLGTTDELRSGAADGAVPGYVLGRRAIGRELVGGIAPTTWFGRVPASVGLAGLLVPVAGGLLRRTTRPGSPFRPGSTADAGTPDGRQSRP